MNVNPNNLKTYLGNPSIKADGVIQNFTQWELDEYLKCSTDPEYFIVNYVKIVHPDKGLINFNLYDYQKKMIKDFKNERFNIVLSSRQSGKTETSAAFILWFVLFHPDKTVLIVANKFEAAKEVYNRVIGALENVPFFLQPGCKILNKSGATFANNSRIVSRATSKNSARGLTVALLVADEFSFVQRDEEFYASTYPVISAGSESKMIITSTPQGIGNTFYKIWQGAEQRTNKFNPIRVRWEDVPGRDEKWKENTLANMSERQFAQEFDCDFIGSGKTLLKAQTLLGLKAHSPIHELNSARIYEKPEPGHKYVLCVDVAKGRGKDYSAFSVIDITKQPFKQVLAYSNNEISPHSYPLLINYYGKLYNKALVIVEANDYGSVVCKILKDDYEYENLFFDDLRKNSFGGIEVNTKSKKLGCSNMKDLIEHGRLEIYDSKTISELSVYEEKGSSYEAAKGHHDDLVATLVLFGYCMSTTTFSTEYDLNLKDVLFNPESLQKIIDSEVPEALISSREETTSLVKLGQKPIPKETPFKNKIILIDNIFGIVMENDESEDGQFYSSF